jgi:hypothetical protein
MDRNNLFAGTWDLVPELCLYQDGVPPRFGTYAISVMDERADFTLAWTDREGKSHELRYGGPVDGSVIPHRGGPVTEMSFSRVDALTLDSAAYAEGREVAWARRCASADGQLLSVLSVSRHHHDDVEARNFQVWRRRNGAG